MNKKYKILIPFFLGVSVVFSGCSKTDLEMKKASSLNASLSNDLTNVINENIKILKKVGKTADAINPNQANIPDYTGEPYVYNPDKNNLKDPVVVLHNLYDTTVKLNKNVINVYSAYANDHFLQSGTPKMGGFRPTTRPWYQNTQDTTNKFYISGPYMLYKNDIMFSVHEKSSDGSFVLGLDVSLDKFTSICNKFDHKNVRIYLVDRKTNIILFSNIKQSITFSIYSALHKNFKTTMINDFKTATINDVEYIINKSNIPNTNWVLYSLTK